MTYQSSMKENPIKELLLFYKEIGADFVEMDRRFVLKDNTKKHENKQENRQINKQTKRVLVNEKTFVPNNVLNKSQEINDSIEKINNEIFKCNLCPLHNTKNNFVPGEGSLNPSIMFIGEGPGEQEDNSGKPFVGDAGLLLDKIIEKMGYNRKLIYIANILKCRPPRNRTPLVAEAKACLPYLKRQIAVLKPKVIVCLGKTATNYLLGKDFSITRVRGKKFEYNNIPVIPTFHPSYILHQRTKETISKAKWEVWSDMEKALSIVKTII